MARSQLWKHQGDLAGHAHFLTHLETSPYYGLFKIRGQGPRVRQPVSSEWGKGARYLESRPGKSKLRGAYKS